MQRSLPVAHREYDRKPTKPPHVFPSLLSFERQRTENYTGTAQPIEVQEVPIIGETMPSKNNMTGSIDIAVIGAGAA